nr:hypothetical protein CFP56_56518 [Quercus suber]
MSVRPADGRVGAAGIWAGDLRCLCCRRAILAHTRPHSRTLAASRCGSAVKATLLPGGVFVAWNCRHARTMRHAAAFTHIDASGYMAVRTLANSSFSHLEDASILPRSRCVACVCAAGGACVGCTTTKLRHVLLGRDGTYLASAASLLSPCPDCPGAFATQGRTDLWWCGRDRRRESARPAGRLAVVRRPAHMRIAIDDDYAVAPTDGEAMRAPSWRHRGGFAWSWGGRDRALVAVMVHAPTLMTTRVGGIEQEQKGRGWRAKGEEIEAVRERRTAKGQRRTAYLDGTTVRSNRDAAWVEFRARKPNAQRQRSSRRALL